MVLSAREFEFKFPRPAILMGIVNVTPDSFSDGGQFLEPSAAIDRALRLVEDGAEIIDIGGESTRPNAKPVSETEELQRVLPVLEGLSGHLSVPLSIDTRKTKVAQLALEAGASIVNDIQANREDESMWEAAAEAGAGYVSMHMKGTPQTMQENPKYRNTVQEIDRFFSDRMSRLRAAGLSRKQVILDVGIGFGKELKHNLELLAGLNTFTRFKRPLLLGVSRKSFIGKLLGSKGNDRLAPSIACACWAVQSGVQIIRAHDVRETQQAIRMIEHILRNRN